MNARVEIFKKDVFAKYRTHIELLEQLTPQLDFENYSSSEYVMRVIDDLKHEINAEYDIAIGYDDDTNGFEGYAEEPDLDEMPTEEEISAFINDLARQAVEETAAPAALPAPEAEPAKAAQTFEEIMAQVKAEEEAELAGAPGAKEDIPAEEEGVNVPVEEPKPEETKAEENAAAISAPAEEKVQEEIVPREETEKAIIIPSNRRSSRKKKKQLASVLEMLREYEEEDARNIPKIEAQLMLNLDDAMESLIESPKK